MNDDYTEKEKQIFRYFDGKKYRFADPVTIRRRMAMSVSPETLFAVLDRCQDKEESIALPAKEQIIGAIRTAFEMPKNPDAEKEEDYGATDDECVNAMNAYVEFDKKKERTTVSTPTSQPPTTSTPEERKD